MGDFPNVHPLNPVGLLSPGEISSSFGGLLAASSGAGAPASTVWPSANRAFYVNVVVPCRATVTQMVWLNGAAVSGNVDAGVYDLGGNKIVSTGSTAQAGINVVQVANMTDTVLDPGNYFIAIAVDNTTATMQRYAPGAGVLQVCGIQQQDTAFALPATATFATPANYLPLFGAAIAATV